MMLSTLTDDNMLIQKLLRSEVLIKSDKLLLTLRLGFFIVSWVHLVIAAVVILPTDLSGDEDPKIRAYGWLKWRLITAWFNFISLAYLPICIYCDWKERRGEGHEIRASQMRRIRDVVFTAILFPTVMFADVMFWLLNLTDPNLISPVRLNHYLPYWGQHSLHTVSLVVVVLDLVLVPRRRPKCLTPRLKLLTTFFFIYVLVVTECYYHGEAVYQIMENCSYVQLALLTSIFYVENLFFFFLQWPVISFLWKTHAE